MECLLKNENNEVNVESAPSFALNPTHYIHSKGETMKLSYRGVTYSYNPPEVETTLGEVAGKYRGLDWRFRNLKKPPVLQPTASLKYRGVYYQTGTKPTPNSTQPTKTPAFSTQEKARSLMHNQKRTLKNRQQSMLYRAAAELGLATHPA